MTATIARNELRLLRRRGVIVIAASGWLLAVAIAIGSGAVRAGAESRDRHRLSVFVEAQRASLTEQLAGSPRTSEFDWDVRSADYVANELGTVAVVPTAPLAALGQGLSDRYPAQVRVTARRQLGTTAGEQVTHPLWALIGRVDLAFCVVYLLPLLVIVLAGDLTVAERRSGTMRLLLSRPLLPSTILRGKLIARGSLLVGLYLASIAAAAVLVPADAGSLGRLLLWCLVGAAYLWFWIGLATAVDARSSSPAASAGVLVSVWLTGVVLLPAALLLLLDTAKPPASGVAVATAVRNATHAASAEGSRLLGRFLEDHPSSGVGQAGMQQYAALQDARDREMSARLQPVLDALETRSVERRRWLQLAAVASPGLLVSAALNDIAGTGPERQARIVAEVQAFQRRWAKHFTPRLLAASSLVPADLRDAPRFRFAEESVTSVAVRVLPAAALLAVFGTVLAWWGARSIASPSSLSRVLR